MRIAIPLQSQAIQTRIQQFSFVGDASTAVAAADAAVAAAGAACTAAAAAAFLDLQHSFLETQLTRRPPNCPSAGKTCFPRSMAEGNWAWDHVAACAE